VSANLGNQYIIRWLSRRHWVRLHYVYVALSDSSFGLSSFRQLLLISNNDNVGVSPNYERRN